MTLIVKSPARYRRDARMAFRAGTDVAALALSSCSAIGPDEKADADSQLALAVGLPLALATPMAVDRAGPSIAADPPLLLALADTAEQADEETPGTVFESDGAETVLPIWSGVLLNTVSLERLAAAEPEDDDEPLPLLLADGSYHWLPPTGVAEGVPEPTAISCIRDIGADLAHVDCAESSDQIALAPTTVDDALLADQRGGFITVGGLQIDIGIQVETLVNGVTQLTTALTLDDVINGGLEDMRIGQVRVTDGDAATDIIHNVGLGSVNTVISNSQDDVNISTLATLAIDVINLQLPHVGNSFNASGRMSPELQQSIVRGIGP